jgi:hypothetical protein
VLVPEFPVVCEVSVPLDVVDPAELPAPVDDVPPLVDPLDEEVTPFAGEPANVLPGVLFDVVPQPTNDIATRATKLDLLTDLVRRLSRNCLTEIAISATTISACRKIMLTTPL